MWLQDFVCVCVCVCVCISMTLEPKYVITVSRRGTYFWDGRHACATKCKKCEEGKAYVLLRWKSFANVSAVLNRTEYEDMVISQDDHMLY